MQNGNLVSIRPNIVDDIMVAGLHVTKMKFLGDFNSRYILCSITSGHGLLQFYGLNVVHNYTYIINLNRDDQINYSYKMSILLKHMLRT